MALYAVLAVLYFIQIYNIYRINKSVFTKEVPEIHRYRFKQVAVLDLTYFVTFGSELAVLSMLPLFFLDTFDLSPVTAGLLASGYALTNLFARPCGGLLSDKFGRKKTLMVLLTGVTVAYFAMSQITSALWLPLAVVITVVCSSLVQAGDGAIFAAVPLIKRRLTGQVAGMVGAYGNIGAVFFLTVSSFVSPQIFFMVIAGATLIVLAVIHFLMEEPQGNMAEVLPDGTVQMIEVG